MAWCFALSAAGCGSGGGASASNDGSDGGYAGVYTATYSGTYVLSSPSSMPDGTSSPQTATITITQLSSTEIRAVWQIAPNPKSGAIDFALSGSAGKAVGTPTGGSCFEGVLDGGNTQTNCCTNCSITFSGDTFVQPNAGTFSGVTPDGVDYNGTYTGEWVGTKQ
jgi:hypothetical protein